MKIVYAIFDLSISGGTRYIYTVANGLVERGHEITILGTEGDSSWFNLKAKVEKCADIQGGGPLNLAKRTIALARHIPRCDILVATYCYTAYATRLARSKASLPFYLAQHYETIFFSTRFARWLADQTYKLGNRHITVSTWLARTLQEKFSIPSEVVNPGVDLELFKPARAKKDKRKTILSVARPHHWKGLQDFLTALRLRAKDFAETRVILVASDGISESIPADLTARVRIVRRVSEKKLAELYSKADVFVYPSLIEGFGLPPLEAMASGCPVVTTDCGGIHDFARDDENVLMIPPKSPLAMADAILEILENEDLARRLVQEGLKTAQLFPWTKTIEKTARILEEAIS